MKTNFRTFIAAAATILTLGTAAFAVAGGDCCKAQAQCCADKQPCCAPAKATGSCCVQPETNPCCATNSGSECCK